MTDLWSFLLQTLTASGTAVLLLAAKRLLRDQLSPRWQYAVWSVLVLSLLLPAGWGQRQRLFPWSLLVEWLKTALTGDYSITRVRAPIPLPGLTPGRSVYHIIYYVYFIGVIFLLLRYGWAYVRLRRALGQGRPAEHGQVERVAQAYGLPSCPAVEVEGLSSAFVCGLLRPVMALPAGTAVDDKVILHELLHLRHHDVAWGLLNCLLRCIHWCNPLLWYCARRADNDAEALCDQRVLERLEGEDRRAYGRILLSMADQRYARAPGTSSLSNGGENIKRRIAAIVHFKRYPRGMALASVCVALVLAFPALAGTPSQAAERFLGRGDNTPLSMAAARAARCTTLAGALDTYGKAVLTGSGAYRALCAPLDLHPALAQGGPVWDPGLPGPADSQSGYFIYNLQDSGDGSYTALLVIPLAEAVDGDYLQAACQTVRARPSADGWVVEPLENFFAVNTLHAMALGGADWLSWGAALLPCQAVYTGEALDFQVRVTYQTVHMVDNDVTIQTNFSWFLGPQTAFDLVPKPHARFARQRLSSALSCVYLGPEEARQEISSVAVAYAPLSPGQPWPELTVPYGDVVGSSTDGSASASRTLSDGGGWEEDGRTIQFGGGGQDAPAEAPLPLPQSIAAALRVGGQVQDHLELLPQKGDTDGSDF